MRPRIVLHTGKGGAGTTSVAAATAVRTAATGARTLLLSADPAHALEDVLDAPMGPEPTHLAEGLWGEQVDVEAELGRWWGPAAGLPVPPGADGLLALLRLGHHAQGEEFDVVVVDGAPAGETLRMLSLPDAVRAWWDRVLPAREHGAAGAARPFARAVLDVAAPGGDLTAVIRGVLALGAVLRDGERTTVRLVATPERAAVQLARRSYTGLTLHGIAVDAVVVNRVLGEETGSWFEGRRTRQAAQVRDLAAALAPVPLLQAPLLADEVRGAAALRRLADVAFGDRDPAGVLHTGPAERLELSEREARLHLPLPLAARDEVSLRQVGSALVVRVREHHRTLPLPPALHGWSARGAELADGALTVDLEAPVA